MAQLDTTPPKKSLIPWIFVAFFGVLIVVNIVFVTLAFDSYSGLADDDPYDRGITYNRVLEGEEIQKALGWSVDLQKQRDQGGDFLRLSAADKAGAPLSRADISAKLYRPVIEGMDQNLVFEDKGEGVFEARLDGVPKGNWELRVLIESGVHSYRFSQRVLL